MASSHQQMVFLESATKGALDQWADSYICNCIGRVWEPTCANNDNQGVRLWPQVRLADHSSRSLDTFPKLLAQHARLRGASMAMRFKLFGVWQSWTWAEVNADARALAQGLRDIGLKRGDKIAILGNNRPHLYYAIMAAQMLGAVPVPVYSDAIADELAYVLDHAEVRFAAVQDQEQVDKLLSVSERVPLLKHIIFDEERGLEDYDLTALHGFEGVIAAGRAKLAADPVAAAALDAEIAAGDGKDVSIMLYTSGTTGRSKGVMLSAEGCINAARDTVAFDKLTEHDTVLAYLPLAWVGDHYLNYAQALVAGFCIACPESSDTVEICLREIGPTFYFAPPRVFENLLTRVTIRMEDAGWLKRRMFKHYIGVAKQWGEKILNGQSVPLLARLSYGLGNMLVYAPLKNALGFSNVRVAYTAGEAIGPELFSFYRSLGLNLKQLYGQTEAFLYVTAQPDGQIRSDTVGPPTPNVDVKIDASGEVLYRSPGQFIGYYKEPEKTAETMTADGYVKTGDAGFFDTTGHLRIIDRAKDVGKLKSGALFAPKYIENKLKFYPNIKEVVAFGQDQDGVACFINIDITAVGNWAERNNVSYGSYQELASLPAVYDIIAAHVDETNKSLAGEPMMAGGQIKRFLILHKELDADDGELTRTQKVRRSFISERYQPLVDALYQGKSEQSISTEVTFEDGRKGVISGNVKIRDAKMFAPDKMERAA
jgi:long-chain acyl-CoA synthetase